MAININGKNYDESKISSELKNTIISRQELLQSKVRHEIELEKIEVLTNHYNTKIDELIKKETPVEDNKEEIKE